jgi:hypothetical protein
LDELVTSLTRNWPAGVIAIFPAVFHLAILK